MARPRIPAARSPDSPSSSSGCHRPDRDSGCDSHSLPAGAREMSRRTECRARLGQIGFALLQYANDNGSKFPLPETIYDSVHKPAGTRRLRARRSTPLCQG